MRLFFVFILLVGVSSVHADYRSMMKGATQTEREIRWLWRYLAEFTYSCTASFTECQDPELRPKIEALVNYLPAYDGLMGAKWGELLEFVSEKDHPELFSSALGEAHRAVMTKNEPYAKVYINTDRMDLPLEDWVGLLAHEAAHHTGIPDNSARIPDRIGAEIARQFKKQIQVSSLEQFGLPKTRTVSFNSEAVGRPSVGFMSWGESTSDIDWRSGTFQPVCAEYETIGRELVSAPVWRVNRLRVKRGVVSIRGGGYVRAVCLNKATGARRDTLLPLAANVDLQYPAPLDLEDWRNQTPTVIFEGVEMAPSSNPEDHKFGMAQTFLIGSIKSDKPVYQAGETWKVQIALRSIDAFEPKTCQAFNAGSQSSYLKQDNLAGTNPFEHCTITNLGGGNWQVDAELVIPKEARPDRYYVPALILSNPASGDRVAIPSAPTFVEVQNPGAPAAPEIKGISIPGLPSTSWLGTIPITNSFRANVGEEFKVEFVVEGPQAPCEMWLDLNFWYARPNGELAPLDGTGSDISLPGILLKTERTPVPGGTKVSMTYKMPASISGIEVGAIKFVRFYMRTTDYSWVEIEMPGLYDSMVVSPRYTH